MSKYETYTKVKQIYAVSPETLRNWARKDQIRYKCIQNANRKTWLYDINSIGEYLQKDTTTIMSEEEKKGLRPSRIIYIRVSSKKQAADLERQRELLSLAFPDTEIISDIASGLNFHRHGFTSLVQGICRDKYTQVVVTFKDRIARFGYELFELLCKEHGCSILVYGDGINTEPRDDESELKDDLLAVVNVFVASHNGKRSAMLKKERKRINQQKDTKDPSKRDTKSETLSDSTSEEENKSHV